MRNTKWEYRTIDDRRFKTHDEWVDELNRLGEYGWELVTLLPAHDSPHATAYFKRHRQE